jgi:hypothetical protein
MNIPFMVANIVKSLHTMARFNCCILAIIKLICSYILDSNLGIIVLSYEKIYFHNTLHHNHHKPTIVHIDVYIHKTGKRHHCAFLHQTYHNICGIKSCPLYLNYALSYQAQYLQKLPKIRPSFCFYCFQIIQVLGHQQYTILFHCVLTFALA